MFLSRLIYDHRRVSLNQGPEPYTLMFCFFRKWFAFYSMTTFYRILGLLFFLNQFSPLFARPAASGPVGDK